MQISIPAGQGGYVARECTVETCIPGYFKVKPGTGIVGGQEIAYCPYCRTSASPSDFLTDEQQRYAKDLALEQVMAGASDMMKRALGLGPSGRKKMGGGLLSIEMSLTETHRAPVRRPLEEELRQDITCPHCGLDQSVYGLATWCADCGADIFLTHVRGECEVVKLMLGDVDRRRELLGLRIAAKDIENCLEDTVSIFEASLKALTRRAITERGSSVEELETFTRGLGNKLQNVERAREVLLQTFEFDLLRDFSEEAANRWKEKRHPITHNLGVIDAKYLLRSADAGGEGREVRVTADEVSLAISSSVKAIETAHESLFSSQPIAAPIG
jgi:hypothetical protein